MSRGILGHGQRKRGNRHGCNMRRKRRSMLKKVRVDKRASGRLGRLADLPRQRLRCLSQNGEGIIRRIVVRILALPRPPLPPFLRRSTPRGRFLRFDFRLIAIHLERFFLLQDTMVKHRVGVDHLHRRLLHRGRQSRSIDRHERRLSRERPRSSLRRHSRTSSKSPTRPVSRVRRVSE